MRTLAHSPNKNTHANRLLFAAVAKEAFARTRDVNSKNRKPIFNFPSVCPPCAGRIFHLFIHSNGTQILNLNSVHRDVHFCANPGAHISNNGEPSAQSVKLRSRLRLLGTSTGVKWTECYWALRSWPQFHLRRHQRNCIRNCPPNLPSCLHFPRVGWVALCCVTTFRMSVCVYELKSG